MATIIRDKIKQPEGKDFKLLDSIDVEHSYVVNENGTDIVYKTSVEDYLNKVASDIPEVINSLESDSITGALSAAKGKALDEAIKQTYTKEEVNAAIAAIEHPIVSVNGKTGEVTLSATDVGALPADTNIPSIDGLASVSYVEAQVSEVAGKIPTVNYPVTSVNDKTGAVTLNAADVGALAATEEVSSVDILATKAYVTEQTKEKSDKGHGHTISAGAEDDDVVILEGTGGTDAVSYKASHKKPDNLTAGTYKSVTVNEYGHITAGTNPTTVADFGITDVYTKEETAAEIAAAKYELPAASADTLGGVKVGAGLSITNGVLSANGGGTADAVEWANILNKPTDVAGYEISDVYTKTEIDDKVAAINEAIPTDIPTKTSELTNDSGFITAIPDEYVTETELTNKGYLTEHQDLSAYAKSADVAELLEKKVDASAYNTDKQNLAELHNHDNKYVKLEDGKGLSEANFTADEKTKLADIDLTKYVTNDALASKGYLTSIPTNYVTETELSNTLATELPKKVDVTSYTVDKDTFALKETVEADLAAHINNAAAHTKAQVGLGNVDNTSDLDKPVSTATYTALNNLKSELSESIVSEKDSWTVADNTGNIVAKVDENGLETTKVTASAVVIGGIDVSEALENKANAVHEHDISAGAEDDDVVILESTGGKNSVSYKASHKKSSLASGKHNIVTIDNYGHVTGVDSPDTLAGYGITNAYTKTEADAKIKEAEDRVSAKIPEVVNNLSTDDATKALSAAQGKAINDAIKNITTDLGNLGGGDMLKLTYDKDNDGIVDEAEYAHNAGKLGGRELSYFATAAALANAITEVKQYADDHDADTDTKYGIEYDSSTKKIKLTSDTTKTEIDATAFIKDGMIDSVELSKDGLELVITWNADAGKSETRIPLSGLIDVYTGSVSNTVTITVTGNEIGAEIRDGVIKNAHIATDAAIAKSKLATEVQTALDKAGTAVQGTDDRLHKHNNFALLETYTQTEADLSSAVAHSKATHARVDATKVENSANNGCIKINDSEVTVYTHPTHTADDISDFATKVAAVEVDKAKEAAKATQDINGLSFVENYAKKSDIPEVSEFIAAIPAEYITESELSSKGYLTEHQDLSAYAKKSELPTVPTATSQLTNDSGFITINDVPNPDLSEYAKKTELPDTSKFITDIPEEYITEAELGDDFGLSAETTNELVIVDTHKNIISSINASGITTTKITTDNLIVSGEDFSIISDADILAMFEEE